jgi:formylglycine-generating enzyme required for sulfatase activity
MKRQTILISLCILLNAVILQAQKPAIKAEDFIPPGTVKISANYFADKTEISNFSWKQFVFDMKSANQNAYPDTLVWQTEESLSNPYIHHYYQHQAYNEYPVVGITQAQAKAFCEWRSKKVMEYLNSEKAINSKVFIPKSIQYRLPTANEWKTLADAGLNQKVIAKNEGKKAFYNFNYSHAKDVTAPVESYFADINGIFNLWGNVAEWVAETNIAVGGSWMQTQQSVFSNWTHTATEAASWIGFRCVCEVEF